MLFYTFIHLFSEPLNIQEGHGVVEAYISYHQAKAGYDLDASPVHLRTDMHFFV